MELQIKQICRLVAFWINAIAFVLITISTLVRAEDTWQPVKDVSLIIESGSVLDFSVLNPLTGPIERRLVVNQEGHFAREDQPQKSLRFLMGNVGLGVATGGFPSHTIADLYAKQFRMHGYNMARLDFIEETLMHNRAADFDFNPEQVERLHYLLAAFRREGIYYVLNGLSSGNAAYGNIKERWINQRNAKLGIYYDVEHQRHWKKMMEKIFTAINPYTGESTLNDPAFAGLILVNEGGLAFTCRNGVPDTLRPQFAEWLKKKYGTTAALGKVWKGELRPGETIDAGTVGFPKPDAWTGMRMTDTQQFFVDLEKLTADWMIQYMRQLGYKGMVTAYNNWHSPAAHVSRSQFDWVDMHNYFAEPSNDVQPGSVMRQDSLLEKGAVYVRDLALSRHLGKAFSVTEFGQVFWNKYRRESGVAVPAYASLQGWDAICQHAHAVKLSYENGYPQRDLAAPFNIAFDPVARAGETLAALLFLRGDVSPANHMVGIKLTPKFVFNDNTHLGGIPSEVSRLSLVTGVGLDWQGRVAKANRYDVQTVPGSGLMTVSGKADASKDPAGFMAKVDTLAAKVTGRLGVRLGKMLVEDERWGARVQAMRKAALIEPGNRTDPEAGVYESDTGQILMDTRRRQIMVKTPKTEAVVFDALGPIDLNNLKIEQADGPALVSVSSLDGEPLQSSRRMLIIFATDARNSGMEFADEAETILKELGKKPVLIKAGTVKLRLRNQNAAQLRVYSNTLRGKRGDVIPVIREADGISFVLDTAKLTHGPTTYFEIASMDL